MQDHHTSDNQQGTPQYASIQDYVRVIRRRRALIGALTLLATAIAFVSSIRQEEVYESRTALRLASLTEPLQEIGIVSGGGFTEIQLARENAELAQGLEIARRVKRQLDSDLTVPELRQSVSSLVGITSGLVEITARAGSAIEAAEIATAFAEQVEKRGDQEALDRLDNLREIAREQVKDARGSEDRLAVQRAQELLNRIDILSTADPVVVAQAATIPASPVSPRPARDTIVGALLGLVLALVVAFVRDALDRTVRSAGEFHQEMGVPVLARVNRAALGMPGLVQRDGSLIREPDFEAFRVLRSNLSFAGGDSSVRSVVVTSGQPDEGKTTVSVGLASAAAIADRRVLLVECDLRRPSFAERLGIEGMPGLSDYLLGEVGPGEVTQTVDLYDPLSEALVGMASGNGSNPTEVEGGLAEEKADDTGEGSGGSGGSDDEKSDSPDAAEADPEGANPSTATLTRPSLPERKPVGQMVCVTAGTRVANPAELLITDRFKDFLRQVSSAYDLVVIDSSPMLSVVDPLEIVPLVDLTLICARAEQTTKDQLHAMRSTLANIPTGMVGGVITGLRPGGPDSYEYYYG